MKYYIVKTGTELRYISMFRDTAFQIYEWLKYYEPVMHMLEIFESEEL